MARGYAGGQYFTYDDSNEYLSYAIQFLESPDSKATEIFAKAASSGEEKFKDGNGYPFAMQYSGGDYILVYKG